MLFANDADAQGWLNEETGAPVVLKANGYEMILPSLCQPGSDHRRPHRLYRPGQPSDLHPNPNVYKMPFCAAGRERGPRRYSWWVGVAKKGAAI